MFSVSTPTNEKRRVLLFVDRGFKNSETFILIEYDFTQSTWWAELNKIPSFPYQMFVAGDTITVNPNGDLYTTGDTPGAYKVTHDAMCQFLIKDITEEELLAEATKLAEETSELERLRALVFHYEGVRKEFAYDLDNLKKQHMEDYNLLMDQLIEKAKLFSMIYDIANESWFDMTEYGSRLGRIRKALETRSDKV